MTEKEFDIQVKSLLGGAEEPVSPAVWEGVAAGLSKKRRIVPFWAWGAGAAAVAAAVALGVFLRPAQPLAPAHSNPIISIAEAPETPEREVATPSEALPSPAPSVQRLAHAHAPSVPAPEVLDAPAIPVLPEPVEEPQLPEPQAVVPAETTAPEVPSYEEDAALLEQIGREEQRSQSTGQGFSLSFSGNLQDKRNGNSPSSALNYRYSAPGSGQGPITEGREIYFSIPFSLGIGLNYNFNNYLGIGTGIRYTYLSRTFEGFYQGSGWSAETDIVNRQHWLGVPLNLYYNFLNIGRWRVHAFAGGAVEFLLDNDYLIHAHSGDVHHRSNPAPPLWSADIGLGLEFKVAPRVGLYLNPGFHYYFADPEKHPRSLRTIQPLHFDVEAGVRFSFGQ